ncbi:MAG: calcium-binding protein [Paracoccus sp. (in: a-proteobacteria)]|uniref:calcium-binding protein n=1 Tax=Paracoccus sp. TaxID=267 RepID=UPI0039E704B7
MSKHKPTGAFLKISSCPCPSIQVHQRHVFQEGPFTNLVYRNVLKGSQIGPTRRQFQMLDLRRNLRLPKFGKCADQFRIGHASSNKPDQPPHLGLFPDMPTTDDTKNRSAFLERRETTMRKPAHHHTIVRVALAHGRILSFIPANTAPIHRRSGGLPFHRRSPKADGGRRLFTLLASAPRQRLQDGATPSVWLSSLFAEADENSSTCRLSCRDRSSTCSDQRRGGGWHQPDQGPSFWEGGGNDDIVGSRAGDFIKGGAGNDTIRAGADDDFIQSSTGNDLIYGGAGDDNIRWGQGNFEEVIGNDTIYGGTEHDLINVWVKDGYLTNGKGVEVKITKVFSDGTMKLTAETDIGGAHSTLKTQGFEQGWTHQGMDTVDGSGAQIVGTAGMLWNTRWGDDSLMGGEGRDTITGGKGDDLISANGEYYNLNTVGDGDQNTLIFHAGHGHDTVLGFDVGIDILDLGARSYTATETRAGTLLTARQDMILLSGIHDFEL